MPIKVNGTTLTGLNVDGTKITKVQVRQNASSPYVTVYEAVTKTKKVRTVNPDNANGFGDDIAAWGYMTANTKTDTEQHFSNISAILFDCDTMQANYNNMETDYKSLVENFNNTPTSDFPIDLTSFSGDVWCTSKNYRKLSYAPGTKHIFYGNLYDFILGRTNYLYGVPSEKVLQADISNNLGNYVHLITGLTNNVAFINTVGDELIENCVEVYGYNKNGKQIIMLYNVSTSISAINTVDAYMAEIADKLNQQGLTGVTAVPNEDTLNAIQNGVFENYQIVIFNAGRLETKFGGPGFREFMTNENGLNWSQDYSKWIIYNDNNITEVTTFVNDALTLSYITPFFSAKIIGALNALTTNANNKMLITNVELSDFAKMNIDRINNFYIQMFGAKSSLWKTCLQGSSVPNNFANVVDAALLTSDLGDKVNSITSSYFPEIVVGYES